MSLTDPDARHGEDPSLFTDADLAELRSARSQDDFADVDAMAMALVERRTGVRLSLDWLESLEEDGPGILIGDIPADPSGRTPLGRVDPDLDARLRGGPASVRRAAVLLAVRAVAAASTWSDPDAVAAAVDAAEHGTPLDLAVRHRLFRMGGNGSHALYSASGADPLDAIHGATYALGPAWPALRAKIDALVRNPGP